MEVSFLLPLRLVKPLLNKPNIDGNILSSYRPTNLPFISKVLEKAVFNQPNTFLNENSILKKFQSSFGCNHSTETALVKIINDLIHATDLNQVSILLDLSSAFDTIDHTILINRLERWVGLSVSALNFQFESEFQSDITGRKFFVSVSDHISVKHDLQIGTAQGSCLGPLLLSLYMLPLGNIINAFNTNV